MNLLVLVVGLVWFWVFEVFPGCYGLVWGWYNTVLQVLVFCGICGFWRFGALRASGVWV